MEIFLFLILLKPSVSFCYLKAYWWNLINIERVIKKRRWIQSRRVLSDRDVMRNMYWGSAKLKLLFQIGIPKFIK